MRPAAGVNAFDIRVIPAAVTVLQLFEFFKVNSLQFRLSRPRGYAIIRSSRALHIGVGAKGSPRYRVPLYYVKS